MTSRALLWCGWADPARRLDFLASVRDLDLTLRAVRALGVRDEDVHAFVCRDDLLPQEMSVSQQHPATIEALRRVVAAMARVASPEDALLFVATSHGERQGLLTSAPVDEFAEEEQGPRLLTPQVLGSCLDGLPGTQVLVLATCHAGTFLPLGRAERVVLASCAADQTYLVQEDPACSPFLVELFRAWCRTELPGYETHTGGGVSELDAAFHMAQQQLSRAYSFEYQRLTPLRQGHARWPVVR